MTAVPFRVVILALLFTARQPAQDVPNLTPEVRQVARLLASDDREVRRAGLDALDALRVSELAWGSVRREATNELDTRLAAMLAQEADAGLACRAGVLLLTCQPNGEAARGFVQARLAAWRQAGGDRGVLGALQTELAQQEGAQWISRLAELAGPGPTQPGALAALALLGPSARVAEPRLRAALAAPPAEEHWRVAVTLAAIGCTEPLRTRLADSDLRLRRCATFALLTDELTALPTDNLLAGLRDRDAIVRRRTLQALPRQAQVEREVVVAAAEIYDDPMIPFDAGRTLLALGPRAAPAMPKLLELISSQEQETWQLRPSAIECLGAIGPAARAAVVPIVTWALASGERSYEARHAGAALAKIAPAEGVTLLARAFAEDLRGEREGLWPSASALRGLGAAATPEIGLFVGALDDGALSHRHNALYVMTRLGPALLPVLPKLLAQLDGDDNWTWQLVGECVRSIGPAAAPLAIPRFEQRFGAASSHLRLQLVVDLNALGVAAEPLLVRASADSDPVVRQHADTALLRLTELTEVGAARLVELLAKTEPTDPQQWLTEPTPWRRLERPLSELATIPPALARRLPELLDHPDATAFAMIRAACVRALCPTAADKGAWAPVLAPLDRQALRRVLTSRQALRIHLQHLAKADDPALVAAARELLPFVE